MEEKVKIAEIDIGVDKLVSKTGRVRQEIANLSEANRALKKDTNKLTTATQEELNQFTKNEANLKSLKKEYRDNTKVVDAYINIQNQDIRTKEQARNANLKLIAIANQLDATNEDQAETLKKVNAEIDSNTDFIKDNASEYENTKINIGNYKESIKGALRETGLFGQQTKGATQALSAFSPIFSNLNQEFKEGIYVIRGNKEALQGLTKAEKAQAIATNLASGALKLFRVALISTGIGAVVVLFASLIAYLSSTQEGINKVNKVLTPLKIVFQSLLGIVQDFGKSLFDAFTNPKKALSDLSNFVKQNLINRFTAFSKILEGIVNLDFDKIADGVIQAGTGVEDLTGKIAKAGENAKEFFDEAYKRGQEIEKISQNLSKTEAEFISMQAKLKKEFEEQKLIQDDLSKSAKEQEEAGEKALKLQGEISKGKIERIKQEAEILRLKQVSNDTSDADKAELATKLAEIDQALQEEASKRKEANNKLNSIRKRATDQAIAYNQKIVDASINNQKEELNFYLASQGEKAKSQLEQLNVAQEVSGKKLEILKAEFEAGKVSEKQYETEKLKIQSEFAQKQAEIAIENANRELDIFKSAHQSRIENNEFLNEELFQQERNRLNKIADAEREFQQNRLEEGIINEQQYNDAIAEVDAENLSNQDKLKQEREEAKKEKEAFDLEAKKEASQEQFENEFEQKREKEQLRYEAKIEEAERLGANLDDIEKKHAQVREQINDAEETAKLNATKSTFGQTAKLLGEKTAAGKAAGIAEATINTYNGVTQVLATPSVLPEPFATIQRIVSTGVVLGSGLKAVKDIAKTKVPKAAQGIGIDLEGPSHGQGGMNLYDENGNPLVNAQGGEKMVILKREASRELDVLSQLNQKHGGVSLSKPMRYAANGGAVISNPSLPRLRDVNFDYNKIGESVGSFVAANINSIQTVVPVNRITDVARKAAQVEQGANL